MLPSDKAFFFWPGKVHMKFLPPVEPTQFNNYSEMKQFVFELMWSEIARMSGTLDVRRERLDNRG